MSDSRPPKGLHLHFDPLSGIAGDMTVAALVDVGVPRAVVVDAIAAMNVPGLRVSFERRQRGAYVGTGFVVDMPAPAGERGGGRTSRKSSKTRSAQGPSRSKGAAQDRAGHDHDHDHDHAGHDHDHDHDHTGHDHDHAGHDHDHDDAGHDHDHDHDVAPGARSLLSPPRRQARGPRPAAADHGHRDYAEIRKLLARATLDPDVKALAAEIFDRIAQAEAHLHGVPVDRIAFHEVGAYDSIADIVGAAAAIVWLAPSAISSSPPAVGTGRVRTAHGLVPIPAPATALLLEDIAVSCEGEGELTTPTGAAILATVVDHVGAAPPMRLQAQGFGAGTREMSDRANVLRVLLGQPLGQAMPESPPDVLLIETNIDDMNPQLIGPLIDALLAAGAVDAWATPILMKKGRPALMVAALAAGDTEATVTQAFFEHSSTIGVRSRPVARTVLERSRAVVKTAHGEVPVKLSAWQGRVLSATPEFEDCRRLASAAGVPVRVVLTAAAAAAQALLSSPAAHGAKAAPARRSGPGQKPRRAPSAPTGRKRR
jgi:uncharacterized protein (TIGR00299 family) protein